MARYFTPEFFTFLRSLKRHNDRTWFADHRQRYLDDVEAPMLQFINDFGPRLREISRAYVADPRRSGGSMFRIYRDTRFSEDKSPFKTWAAARFAHERRKEAGERAGVLSSPGPRGADWRRRRVSHRHARADADPPSHGRLAPRAGPPSARPVSSSKATRSRGRPRDSIPPTGSSRTSSAKTCTR